VSTANIVSVSGGKDSTAMALLALERRDAGEIDNISFVFADTGHEHHKTYEYVEYLETQIGPITKVKADFSRQIAGKREFILKKWEEDGVSKEHIAEALEVLQPTGSPMLDLCLWKGRFPSTRRRFCSEQLKHIPIDEGVIKPALEEYDEVISWQGVRRDESRARANLLEEEDHPDINGLVWYRPILDWTAEDVFAMADKHGVAHNPLYKEGMGRVGCMPCIHARKDELFEIANRFPEELKRLHKWEELVSNASKRGVSTWMDGRIACRLLGESDYSKIHWTTHGIDLFIEWSRTTRGGHQYDLIKQIDMEEPEQCKSLYGLCE